MLIWQVFWIHSLYAPSEGVIANANDIIEFEGLGSFSATNFFGVSYLPDKPLFLNTTFRLYITLEEYIVISLGETLKEMQNLQTEAKIIVHGWLENADTQLLQDIKNQMMQKLNVTVIMVDWGKGADANYFQSATNAQLVGREVAVLVKTLVENMQMNPRFIHLVGFSLGAQVSGYAGQWIKATTNNSLGRISGLDPAGLWFTHQADDNRLDKTDADYVDVVHTTSGLLGDRRLCGHVDYYVNGGQCQPGCSCNDECSHEMALKLYKESIGSNLCTSCSCPEVVKTSNVSAVCTSCFPGINAGKMGYYSDTSSARGPQYVRTKAAPPYCVL